MISRKFIPRFSTRVLIKRDICKYYFQVLGTKNPTDATLVLSKMERILSKMVELSQDLAEDEKLELVFDGRNEHLTFFKVKAS